MTENGLNRLVSLMYGLSPGNSDQTLQEYALLVGIALQGENVTATEVDVMLRRLAKSCKFRPAPCEYLDALREYRREVYETGPAFAVTVTPALPGQTEVIRIVRGPEAEVLIAERKAMEAMQALPTPDEVAEHRRRLRGIFLQIVDSTEMPKEAEA